MKIKRHPGQFLLLVLFILMGAVGAIARTAVPRAGDSATLGAQVQPPARLNTYQRENLSNYLVGTVAPLDTLRVLAIQLQFSDSLMGGQPGSHRPEVRDSTWFANELSHVNDYFVGVSRDRTHVVYQVTSKLYTLPQPMGYYGEDAYEDVRGVEMMQDAVALADVDEDFSLYDTFMLIHAGAGQETDVHDDSRAQIYSTFFDRKDIDAAFPDSSVSGLPTSDMKDGGTFLVDNFMILPANPLQDDSRNIRSSLGIWVYEVGSRFGLVPLFDSTPAGFPDSRGVGDYCVMSYGLYAVLGYVPVYPCVFNRLLAGWVDPLVVESDGNFRLRDVNTAEPADTACIKIPITETEYLLVVNRVHDTNFDSLFTFADADTNLIPDNDESFRDMEFDFFMTSDTNPYITKFDPNIGRVRDYTITGTGIYIWHIDESVLRQNIAAGYLPDDFYSRKTVDLEEADGIQDLDRLSVTSSHWDSYRDGNNTEFGPDTKPGSESNSGAPTNIRIFNISGIDSFMTLSVSFSKPFTETRTRWSGEGERQSPTPVDLDGTGGTEIVMLASGGLYAFNGDGSEYVDNVPDSIEALIPVPGAKWKGAPAIGDIDGGGDVEIVAADSTVIYAWKTDGTEVTDGDSNAGTTGPLYVSPTALAAPPLLVNIDADPELEIAIVEHFGDSLVVDFLDATGQKVLPADPGVQARWPFVVAGQIAAPLAWGAVGSSRENSEGIVVTFVDTLSPMYGVTVAPVRIRSGNAFFSDVMFLSNRNVRMQYPATSAPAVGDLNGDGFDEATFTLADGRLVILAPETRFLGAVSNGAPTTFSPFRIEPLRAQNPSAPAIGDVDGNGTMEIVTVDDEYFYVFENNGRLHTNWPRPRRDNELGSWPDLRFDRMTVSPLIGEVSGNGVAAIIFPDADGTIYGFRGDGKAMAGFPRVGPAQPGTAPTLFDLDNDGELSLVSLGAPGLVQTIEPVSDTIVDNYTMVLSIQSLPGSNASDKRFWAMYQNGTERRGTVTESNPLQTSGKPTQPNSFIVYPNPVRGSEVHARIIVNAVASIEVEIYNLEGEKAITRKYTQVNAGGGIATPFDEILDVGILSSGVYMMRIHVDGANGSETHVKTFAVLK